MWPRKHRPTDGEGPINARVALARLESVIDRLEGVYQQMEPAVEAVKRRPPDDKGARSGG